MSKTFEQFVSEGSKRGSITNLLFETGMYSLSNDLEGIVKVLRDAGVRFEIVGGVAVNAHIFLKNRGRSFVTRDIDVLLHRSDLERVANAAEALGYKARKMVGGFMLIRPEQDAGEAVHILFVGEKSKSTQPLPHPELHPEEKRLFDFDIPVAPLVDLLQMKLSSLRPKDLIHLEILDDLGLITPAFEKDLPSILRERLQEARKQIAANKPDVIED
jgi:hypothetical protein